MDPGGHKAIAWKDAHGWEPGAQWRREAAAAGEERHVVRYPGDGHGRDLGRAQQGAPQEEDTGPGPGLEAKVSSTARWASDLRFSLIFIDFQ